MLFEVLCVIHVIVWVFVLTAFCNETTARINLNYVVPGIYVLHMLPFHILTGSKKLLIPDDNTRLTRQTDVESHLWGVAQFKKVQNFLDARCYFNPLSVQGMMLWGVITSNYTLHRPDGYGVLMGLFVVTMAIASRVDRTS